MEITDNLKEALRCYENNDFDGAIKFLDLEKNNQEYKSLILKIYSSIYLKKENWIKFIEVNTELLKFKEYKKLSLLNIGNGKHKLGKITEAINYFKLSMVEVGKNEVAHQSLGVCFMEKGEYEKSLENFIKAVDLNKKNLKSAYSIIYLLNFIKPKIKIANNLLSANEKILSLNNKIKTEIPNDILLKEILEKSDEYVKEYCSEIIYNERQIFRRNLERLDCNRHFKVFNRYKVIPKYCFNCFKIQIITEDVVELIKLFFLFNQSFIEKSVLRKCMVETRPNVGGNYKGLVYFKNLEDCLRNLDILKKKLIETNIKIKLIEIKHGCTEFYKEYPKFKDVNINGKQKMNYKQEWNKYENIVDSEYIKRNKEDTLFTGSTINLLTLSDILIIQNWFNYADLLGDKSYKKIFKNKIRVNLLDKVLKNQYEFRKNEL